MNIEQARSIHIIDIFEAWGIKPKKERGVNRWYLTPWRDERTASLKVNLKNNYWYDFGEGSGGDIIAFIQRDLKGRGQTYTVSDVLQWLDRMPLAPICTRPAKAAVIVEEQKTLSLQTVKSLHHPLLISYI